MKTILLSCMPFPGRRNWVLGCLGTFVLATCTAQAREPDALSLRKSLTFCATFDRGVDADFAQGDASLWYAAAMNQRVNAAKGLPVGGEVKLDPRAGKFGGALSFSKSAGPMVFYKAEKNFPMPAANWAGTISFWLSTDPAKDLNDGFCDPIQLTSKQWDDAAIFVEFEKRPAGIPFRLGVYADHAVWNPTRRKFEEIPAAERPLASVEKPPFAAGKWTHVAVVIESFNTQQPNGLATLYLDGKKAGEISRRTQTFTWDPPKADLMLGLGYIGLMDEIALFDRALSPAEITALYALSTGVKELTAGR